MRKKTSRKNTSDRKAIVLIVASLLVVIVIFFVQSKVKEASRFDKDSLCPLGGAESETVVVIDKSDKWGADDIGRVKSLLVDIYKNIHAHHRLKIISISGKGRESTNIDNMFDKCSPGNEKECNAIYQNCRRIMRRYRKSFEEQIKNVVNILERPGESSYSPLFEVFTQVVDDNDSQDLVIHLVSDLMENGSKFRFYDEVPLAEEIVKEYPLNVSSKITTYLHVVERKRHSRELIEAVKNVWSEYLKGQGLEVSVKRLFIAE